MLDASILSASDRSWGRGRGGGGGSGGRGGSQTGLQSDYKSSLSLEFQLYLQTFRAHLRPLGRLVVNLDTVNFLVPVRPVHYQRLLKELVSTSLSPLTHLGIKSCARLNGGPPKIWTLRTCERDLIWEKDLYGCN